MDIQGKQMILSALSGAIAGAIVGSFLSAAKQKMITRRETLLKFHFFYDELVDNLSETIDAGVEFLDMPRTLAPYDKDKLQNFNRAKEQFQKKAVDVLELTLLIKMDFHWSKDIFAYFNPAIQQCKKYVSNLEVATKRPVGQNVVDIQDRGIKVLDEIGYRYANVKDFFILQMNISWVVLPTLCLFWRMFYERAIGCSFSKWLFHKYPPELEKEVPICCLVMGKLNDK